MENQLDLNLNNAECLREKTEITHTEVYNVCNGETYQVPHGTIDIAGGAVLALMVVITLAFLGRMLYMVITDY